jgi:hypothetical protein
MRQFLLLTVVVLAACAVPGSQGPRMARVGAATAAEAAPPIVSPGPAKSTRTLGALANLPDRGELLSYPDVNRARREGAYTWHRAEVSEEHALRAIGRNLRVVTPSGDVLDIKYDHHIEHPSGDWSWIGHLEGHPGAQTILTFGAQAVFGSIAQIGKRSLRLTSRDSRAWLVETDPSKLVGLASAGANPDGPDHLAVPKQLLGAQALLASRQPQSVAVATAAAPVTMDVLVGYTGGIASRPGGASAALTRINNLVTITNEAFTSSQVNARVRLVHSMQVTYTDTSTNESALEQLTGYDVSEQSYTTPNAAFNALRAAREQYGADLVVLLRQFRDPEQDGCGIAWLIGGGLEGITPGDGYDYFGYSVVGDGTDRNEDDGQTYFCRDESFAHELAHNMGSAHDRITARGDDGVLDNPDDYGAFSYSFGYKTALSAGNFYTIMAYGDQGQTDYRVYSNPRITLCGGRACGTVNDDNARSLNQTTPAVATFRASLVADPSGGVRNDVNGDARADLIWHKAGALSIWYMNGYTIQGTASYTPGSNLYPYVTGTFNAGASADIGWRDDNGTLIFWLGGPPYVRGAREHTQSLGWRLQASGDHNGDGISDLYWRSAIDGRLMYWLMDGTQQRTAANAFAVIPSLELVVTGDFNGDGRSDLFFRRRTDGVSLLWRANGTGFLGSNPGSISKYWVPAGAADYDGDGDDDIVWRSSLDSRVMVWVMQNAQRVDLAVFPSDADRALLGVADTNGDERLDLVWRRNDGAVTMWMGQAGGTFLNRYVGVINTTWKFVPATR